MGRRTLEQELVEAEFPLYTPEFRAFVDKAYSRHKHAAHPDELMLDAVWEDFSGDFRKLVVSASEGEERALDRAKAGELTAQGRAALLSYIDRAQDLAESLLDLNDEQFAARYASYFAEAQAAHRASMLARGERQDRFAFFNLPKAEADIEAWRAKAVWTLEEAVALSFGKEPSVVNVQTLRTHTSPAGSPFRDRFVARLDTLTRAASAKDLSEPIVPTKFLKWAGEHGIDLPASLSPPSRAADTDADHLHANRLHRFYRILMGVAMQKYGFDIGKDDGEEQEGVFAALANDLKNAKLPVSEKTLRTYLRDARAWIATTDLAPAKKAGKKIL